MTKVEYLAKLDRYLRKLPKDDYQEAMDYFREYFDEAGPENEEAVIAELGTPKEAARDIISRLLDEKIIDADATETPKKWGTMVWIASLAVLATPVALPLALLIFGVLITILALGLLLLQQYLRLQLLLLFQDFICSLTAGLTSVFLTQQQHLVLA